jgi:hypothetical protein
MKNEMEKKHMAPESPTVPAKTWMNNGLYNPGN